MEEIKLPSVEELKKQINCECNWGSYPTDAWCPIGCGTPLVMTEDNLYFCAYCKMDFKIVENESKYDTKAQSMWKISKEQEEVFRKGLLSRKHSEEELDELFKLIRGAEYRRGKDDLRIEHEKDLKPLCEKLKNLCIETEGVAFEHWVEQFDEIIKKMM